MSNGEPKSSGRELLEQVLGAVARSRSYTPTERMRAALSLGVLDGSVDLHEAPRIRDVVNGPQPG